MFHKHKFKKEGLSLWCECGKVKELKCCHKWELHKENHITYMGIRDQTMHVLICKLCGKIKTINITTGKQIDE